MPMAIGYRDEGSESKMACQKLFCLSGHSRVMYGVHDPVGTHKVNITARKNDQLSRQWPESPPLGQGEGASQSGVKTPVSLEST
jgi:hypothetical protein